jgi:hypothetical protein
MGDWCHAFWTVSGARNFKGWGISDRTFWDHTVKREKLHKLPGHISITERWVALKSKPLVKVWRRNQNTACSPALFHPAQSFAYLGCSDALFLPRGGH